MKRSTAVTIIEFAALALITAAVVQELAKPREERNWHGRIAGIVPYDFRPPTWDRIRESYWNPYDRRVLTPQVFGLGWGLNIFILLENMGLIHPPCGSEEDFLMPNRSLKEILKPSKSE